MSREQRKRYLQRWETLKSERSQKLSHWRELADHIQPARARFLLSDRNKPYRNSTIINSAPRKAARTLASGMMAGVTSPARPWFRLAPRDPGLAEYGPVKEWLHGFEEALRDRIARSNLYNCLHSNYNDLPTFGIGALHIDEDHETLFRGYVHPVGLFAVAVSDRQEVDTIYRETTMTVGQMVRKFGEQACSGRVRELYKRHEIDTAIEILHLIEPNDARAIDQAGPRGMPFRSVWLELGGSEEDGLLRESGYEELPTMTPRWDATDGDAYGYGPGSDVLGDCRALQQWERRKATALDMVVTPPMNVPSAMMGKRFSLLPAAVNYVDAMGVGMRAEASVEVPYQAMTEAREAIREFAERIGSGYYSDLWLMMAQGDSPQMTAREIAERHEEKMLQLGPVMERLEDELLDPFISRVSGIMLRTPGVLPEPPPELQGQDLRVQYTSIVAQAQKLIGVSAMDRFIGVIGQVGSIKPSVLDKLNEDKFADEYAEALGIPPGMNNTAEEVQRIREARAAQQQAQAQGEALMQAAQGAKTLSDTPMGNDSALDRLLGAYGAAPPAGGTR